MVLTTTTLDDFVDILSTASDSERLMDALDAHVRSLGFEKFAYHLVRPPEGPRSPFF